MPGFLRWYRYVNILSIDTAVGAVISAMFFARLSIAWVWIYGKIALGLTVWIIYTADHLIDAKKVKGRASSERHRFHQKYFYPLVACVIVAIALDLVFVSFMRKSLLYYGLALSLVVLLYLIVSRYLHMFKELFIAMIYTIGIMLPGLADRENHLEPWHLVLMFSFFLVAFANLLIFSWFDLQNDHADGHQSFVTFYGKGQTQKIVHVLYVLIIAISIYLIAMQNLALIPTLVVFGMMSILILILRYQAYFDQHDRYRYVGDAIFFLPGIYILLHPFDAWPY